MRTCTECKETLELIFFSPDIRSFDGRQAKCKKCKSAKQCQYSKTEKGLSAKRKWNKTDKARNAHYRRTFGITLEEYNKLFNNQDGSCAICKNHQSTLKRTLHVDHNHKDGKVRGLLCYMCNRGLGLFYDNYKILLRASIYLKTNS